MTHILLLGANGQVGWELQRSLAPLGKLIACTRRDVDLQHPHMLEQLVDRVQPAVIVNAAAYTAVDKAESESDIARRINAESVALLAKLAAQRDAWFVHYSTDYVFNGKKLGPYLETDPTCPLNMYGETKLEGEHAILDSGCKHLTFRTSWVYARRGNNFAKAMLKLAAERESLKVVADQIGAPTSAELIADVTALAVYHAIKSPASSWRLSDIYHLAASGETSWYEYARFVIEAAEQFGKSYKVSSSQVQPISTAEYPTQAMRPANSRLDISKLENVFGITLPHWQMHASRLVAELNDARIL